eukprot:1592379-Karenia_brevis.AAC.1
MGQPARLAFGHMCGKGAIANYSKLYTAYCTLLNLRCLTAGGLSPQGLLASAQGKMAQGSTHSNGIATPRQKIGGTPKLKAM